MSDLIKASLIGIAIQALTRPYSPTDASTSDPEAEKASKRHRGAIDAEWREVPPNELPPGGSQ